MAPVPAPTVPVAWAALPSAIGRLTVAATERGLHAIWFAGEEPAAAAAAIAASSPAAAAHAASAVAALETYFAGTPDPFAYLALDLAGTPFQQDVWAALQAIPAGETSTYLALAHAVGRPTAVRAVGAAVGRTPVPIVVPCHRAVGSDGSLTGYRGGLERKRTLLDHERGVASLQLA